MRHIVAFDFDGTLTKRDTFIDIIRHTYGLWALICGIMRLSPWLLRWKLGRISNSEAKRRLFAHFFSGMSQQGFNDTCTRYFKHVWPGIIREGAQEKVRKHIDAGDTVVIVSASPSNWVKPFAEALGISMVIATGISVDSTGRIADHFATPNCHGLEKVRRLIEAFGEKETFHLTAYGDSSGDREMLALADICHYKPFRK